jgi:short-subunit dehydrogenase
MAAQPVTLITQASAGIGAALAWIFAGHGHDVFVVAPSALDLNALADDIAAAGHKRPFILALDLLRADATVRIEHELRERGLEAQYVVNRADFCPPGDDAAFDRIHRLAVIDVNVRALTDLSLRFVDSVARHRGGILNIVTVAAFLPGPGCAVCHAAQAYVLSFTEALHRELAPRGIRVTALCTALSPPQRAEPLAQLHSAHSSARSEIGDLDGVTRAAMPSARAGYEGLMRGRRLIVPGLKNKVIAALPRLLPRRLVLDIARSGWIGGRKSDT